MVQVFGPLNTDLRSEDDDEDYDGGGNNGNDHDNIESYENSLYCDEDIFGRRFLLTVEPLPQRPK